MTIHPIRLLPDPVLRRKAIRVASIDASIHQLTKLESLHSRFTCPHTHRLL